MAKIAYVLLCHKDPDAVVAQADRLTRVGDFVAIHVDRRAPEADHAAMRAALADNPRVAFASRRIRCGWGEWSLVAATLAGVETALAAFPRATHLYLISGDCMPIRTGEFCHDFLDRDGGDLIESHDFMTSDWIRTGLKEERLTYRHVFNERTRPRLFYAAYEAQKRLGLARAVPPGLRVMIGSQWWCLRRATVEAILGHCRAHPRILRFFRTTWIPDETFFQTLVRLLVPAEEIRNRTPTFLIFSDYGLPVNFYDDHYDFLLAQDHLFARKISPEAATLNARLGDLYAARGVAFPASGDGKRIYQFLAGRGRVGRRFAPRFWERESSLGHDREILVLTCKKWHVAKRLADRISAMAGVPSVGYLFAELEAGLPDLGGIERTLAKRNRHRRALVRVLLDQFDSDRLILCLDPSEIDVMRDFAADRCVTRILSLDCALDDDYLVGHAQRLGLLGQTVTAAARDRILPTLRADVAHEARSIRTAGFAHLSQIAEADDAEARAAALGAFLGLTGDALHRIADLPYLFED